MGNKKGIETVFRYSQRILAYQGHVHWSKISLYRQSPLSPSRHVFLRFSGRPISLCSYARRFSVQFLEIRVLYLIFIRYSKCNTNTETCIIYLWYITEIIFLIKSVLIIYKQLSTSDKMKDIILWMTSIYPLITSNYKYFNIIVVAKMTELEKHYCP